MPAKKTKGDIQKARPHEKNNREKRFFLDKRKRYLTTKLICKYCRAIYDGKGWEPFEKLDPKMIDQLHMSICPACHEEKEHVSDGVLHLSGDGVIKNKNEIKNLIHNTAAHEESRDILNRVERMDEKDNTEMIVYTTKNQLAVEIGQKIADAFKGGKLDIHWSKQDKPVEVWWHHD